MLNRNHLHDYQNRAIDFICHNDKCALWLDMGLGKTVSTLTAITDLIDSFTVERVLIIAPLRVANNTWHNEIANWQHLQGLTYSICTGSANKRIDALNRTADIYIINRENIPWLVKHYGDKWPFDMVVIDESSSFKSAKAQRFKELKKVLKHVDRLVELTGTPTSNGLLDLWAQMYLLDYGERLGRNMTVYKSRFFESDYMGYKFTPRKDAEQQIYDLIDDLCMTMLASDYLELPQRIDLRVPVSLPTKLHDEYKQLERDFVAMLNDEEVAVFNAATLAGKLLQFCNGAVYTNEQKDYVELHDLKIKALQDIVDDNPSENILVAYNYKTDLVRLQKAFPDAVVLDKAGDCIADWNDGKIKMLLAHPASAGHGLNLQHGGSMIVWFGLNWSLELVQQFNARLYRQGQTKPVRVVSIVTDGCIDDKVIDAIHNKAQTQNDLLNALKK
jgi:hypothetical protein